MEPPLRHKNDPAVKAEAEMRRLLAAEAPFTDDGRALRVGGEVYTPDEVIRVLRPYVTDERAGGIEAVLAERTLAVVPVVEGLMDTGNVSAVMRSAEALGYQQCHVIEGDVTFKRSDRISSGADKWLDVRPWQAPADCAAYLKAHGYRIVATHLEAAVPISEIDFTQRTALVFGNEKDGLSREMLALADQRCRIPTSGFVQSFNISVAAALCLYHAYRDRIVRQGRHGDLGETERELYRALYYVRSVQAAEKLLAHAHRAG